MNELNIQKADAEFKKLISVYESYPLAVHELRETIAQRQNKIVRDDIKFRSGYIVLNRTVYKWEDDNETV